MDSKNYPQYWHVAIVTDISWDKVKVLESNWWDDKQVHERWVDKSSIYGYFDPSKTTTQTVQYDPSKWAIYAKFLDWFIPNWPQQEYLNQMNIDPNTVLQQAEAWKHDHQKQYITPMLDTIERLIANYNEDYALWGSTWARGSLWLSEWFNDFIWDYYYLKDNLTLSHLTELKEQWATFWALSDNELNAIWNSATALRLWWSQAKYESELLNIYNNFLSSAWLNTITIDELRARSWSTSTTNNWMGVNVPYYLQEQQIAPWISQYSWWYTDFSGMWKKW